MVGGKLDAIEDCVIRVKTSSGHTWQRGAWEGLGAEIDQRKSYRIPETDTAPFVIFFATGELLPPGCTTVGRMPPIMHTAGPSSFDQSKDFKNWKQSSSVHFIHGRM